MAASSEKNSSPRRHEVREAKRKELEEIDLPNFVFFVSFLENAAAVTETLTFPSPVSGRGESFDAS